MEVGDASEDRHAFGNAGRSRSGLGHLTDDRTELDEGGESLSGDSEGLEESSVVGEARWIAVVGQPPSEHRGMGGTCLT